MAATTRATASVRAAARTSARDGSAASPMGVDVGVGRAVRVVGMARVAVGCGITVGRGEVAVAWADGVPASPRDAALTMLAAVDVVVGGEVGVLVGVGVAEV